MEIKPTIDYNFDVKQGDKVANLTHPPIKISILIATMPSRVKSFQVLWFGLQKQHTGYDMEILYDNSMDYNIGTKRNKHN